MDSSSPKGGGELFVLPYFTLYRAEKKMEKSFGVLAGFEHEAEMLNGYNELVECVENGLELTAGAAYANSVLNVQAADENVIVAGQEGFLDSVKRGANKVYEWIMSMLRAIKEWLFGKPRKVTQEKQNEVDDLSKLYDELTASIESLKTGPIEKVIAEIKVDPKERLESYKQVQRARDNVRRLAQEDKAIIENELKEQSAEELGIEITDRRLVKEMLERFTTRLDSIKHNVDEISRIDPDQTLSDELGIKIFMIQYGKGGVDNVTGFFRTGGAESMNAIARKVINLSNDLENEFAKASKKLEKIAEEAKGGTDQAANRKASRAAAIIKEMGEAAAKMRDLILTLDAQLLKTCAKIQTGSVRSAMMKAMPKVSELSQKYLQQAIDELNL